MNISRSLTVALVLSGASATIPCLPAQEAGDQANQIVDRIVAGEQDFVAQMKDEQPFVETYIQEMTPTGSVLRDHYMLLRMDLNKSADQPITESSAFKRPFFRLDLTNRKLHFYPAGFLRMAFVDLQAFSRDNYHFEFMRREFLGDVRCLVFQVSPQNPGDGSRFLGDIWVDDAGYRIVRFNGTFTNGKASSLFFHFDSWRVNAAPGLWLPAYVYVEEGNDAPNVREKYRLKGRVMLWGYEHKPGDHLDELSDIKIDSDDAVDKTASTDMLPVESQREWEREAEENVLDKLERSGLLAPKGDVDRVLNTVVNNLEVTNHLDLNAECRVLLTTPMETFSMYRTIVISRGLLDVLPDEASLAMVLAEELAHLALGQKTPTAFAFGDSTIFDDQAILARLNVSRTPAEMDAAGKKAVEILNNSPYAPKLAGAGLFLKEIASHSENLGNLVEAHLGNELASRANIARLAALEEKAPPLEESKLDQIAALPLGSRVKLNPWSDQITLAKAEQLPLRSAHEKMPFEITPVMLHLTRIDQQQVGAAEKAPAAAQLELNR